MEIKNIIHYLTQMKLTGQKIVLRYPTMDDKESIAKYCADKEISKFTFIPYPYALQDAVDFIKFTDEIHQEKTGLHLAIEDKNKCRVVGMIGLNVINYQHLRAEVGYWLAKEYWGKGYAIEALTMIGSYAFTELHMERLYAFVQPDNIASWKLLEKAGFEREGLLKKLMKKDTKRFDHYIYAKLKENSQI